MSGIKGKSGGFRPNSGRKKTSLSDRQIRKLIRAVNKKAKEKDTTWADEFAGLLFDSVAHPRDRIGAFKLFLDVTTAKKSEVEVKEAAAPIILPERRPDPAKVIPLNGKKAEVK